MDITWTSHGLTSDMHGARQQHISVGISEGWVPFILPLCSTVAVSELEAHIKKCPRALQLKQEQVRRKSMCGLGPPLVCMAQGMRLGLGMRRANTLLICVSMCPNVVRYRGGQLEERRGQGRGEERICRRKYSGWVVSWGVILTRNTLAGQHTGTTTMFCSRCECSNGAC